MVDTDELNALFDRREARWMQTVEMLDACRPESCVFIPGDAK